MPAPELNDAIAYLHSHGYEVRDRPTGLHICGPGMRGPIAEDVLLTSVKRLADGPKLLPALHVSPLETVIRRTIVAELGPHPDADHIRQAADLLLLIAEDLELQACRESPS